MAPDVWPTLSRAMKDLLLTLFHWAVMTATLDAARELGIRDAHEDVQDEGVVAVAGWRCVEGCPATKTAKGVFEPESPILFASLSIPSWNQTARPRIEASASGLVVGTAGPR